MLQQKEKRGIINCEESTMTDNCDDENPSERSQGETAQATLSEAYLIENGSLKEISVEKALGGDFSSDTAAWINTLYDDTSFRQVHEQILKDLPLSPFLRRHLNQPSQLQTPQVLPLQDAVFIVMRILDGADAVRHTAILCLKSVRLMVTATHHATAAHSGSSRRRFLAKNSSSSSDSICHREVPQASVSGCLCAFFSHHVGRTASAAYKLRDEIADTLELIDSADGISAIQVNHIIQLRNSFIHISAVAEEQNQCLQSLPDAEGLTDAIDFTNLKNSFGVLLSTAGSTERIMDRLEQRIGDVRHLFDAHQQARINHRLNLLTIMSAVFLPLSLLAGIWGMNFHNMPELERDNAYYFALSTMAGVAIVLLSAFYWNGWLS